MTRIRSTSKTQGRITSTSPTQPRLDPDAVAKALGAERVKSEALMGDTLSRTEIAELRATLATEIPECTCDDEPWPERAIHGQDCPKARCIIDDNRRLLAAVPRLCDAAEAYLSLVERGATTIKELQILSSDGSLSIQHRSGIDVALAKVRALLADAPVPQGKLTEAEHATVALMRSWVAGGAERLIERACVPLALLDMEHGVAIIERLIGERLTEAPKPEGTTPKGAPQHE